MWGVCLVALLAGCVYSPSPAAEDASRLDGPSDAMPPDTMPPDTMPQPFWLNVVGATATDGNLVDTATSGWNHSGAITRDQIASGNGFVAFSTSENTRAKAFGLSNGDTDADIVDIDYALQLKGDKSVNVVEKGVPIGAFGEYLPNEVFRIEVVNNVVTYKRGNIVFFVSTAAPTFPLVGDAALFSSNSTITNVSIGSL